MTSEVNVVTVSEGEGLQIALPTIYKSLTFCNIHRRTTKFGIHLTKDILLIAGRGPYL